MPDLKPCPFCGKTVEVIEPWTSAEHKISHCGSIRCVACGYSIGWHYPFIEKVWNNRANANVAQNSASTNIPMQVRTQIAAWADTIDEWDQESQGWGVFESMKREMRQLLHG